MYMTLVNNLLRFVYYPIHTIVRLLNKSKFGRFGSGSYLKSPLRIDSPENIYIGNDVSVGYKTWLAAVPLTGGKSKLIIEDGSILGNFNHIYATRSIIIHKRVLTADKVYISDNLHGYDDVKIPIMDQPIVQKKIVEIGEGTWIGENVCIIGATVGNHCVIGANSVVTKDIPDFSVAVGSPAKVIKKYDFLLNKWIKVE